MLSVVYAECHMKALCAKCIYAECRYAECRYAECRGAKIILKGYITTSPLDFFSKVFNAQGILTEGDASVQLTSLQQPI
jgi:hypothetical protein